MRTLIDHEAPLFTFDDGPSEWTPQILDLLREHQTRAVFFVTGTHVEGRKEIVRRAYREGHRIGNHGWSHRRLTMMEDAEVRDELVATQRAIGDAIGVQPRVWRPPYFDVDESGREIARRLGLRLQGADLIPNDWMATDPELLAAVVLDEVGPGCVVSLHDGVPPDGGSTWCTDSRAVTVEALRIVLEALAVKA